MIKKLLLLMMTILLVISPSCVIATDEEISIEKLNDNTDAASWIITDFNLAIGDFINNLITQVVGQKITIQKLVFNEVNAVNPNFFSSTRSQNSVHQTVKEQVNIWYSTFHAIAITFYMAGLLAIGIKILLTDTPLSKSKAKDVAMHWLIGIFILFMFKIVMQYAFQINEGFVKELKNEFDASGSPSGTVVGVADDAISSTFEFRSPDYRSRYSGIITFGGEEINDAYVSRLGDYRATADMMRIMRAYAGVSHRIIFCIIWFVLLFQLIILLVKYYKRYFLIALLVVLFPFVTIYYLIDAVKGKSCEVFRVWCIEFFVNVFTQSIHAIIYSIIASVCINRVKDEMSSGKAMNWIIIICAINFLFQGEKIVRKLLGADKSMTDRGVEEASKSGRKGVQAFTRGFKRIGGMFGIGKGE